MNQSSTCSDAKGHGNKSPRPWQFGLKQLFAFTAVVAFLLGFYIALYPFSRIALPVLIVSSSVFIAIRIATHPWRPCRVALATFVVLGIYVASSFIACGVVDFSEPLWRECCTNNLKQIMLALHNYHTDYGCFPPAYVADANGRPMHSWRTLILPYMEQGDLYKLYRWDEPWDGPNNRRLLGVRVSGYECPERRKSSPSTTTSYVAVIGPETAWPGTTPLKHADFREFPRNTIMVVETVAPGIHWIEPRDLDFASMPLVVCPKQGGGISSLHRDTSWREPLLGAHAAMADGSVRLLPVGTSPEELRALLTRSGGEKVLHNF